MKKIELESKNFLLETILIEVEESLKERKIIIEDINSKLRNDREIATKLNFQTEMTSIERVIKSNTSHWRYLEFLLTNTCEGKKQ